MDFNDVTSIFKGDLSRVERSIQENYQSDVPLIPGIGNYLLKKWRKTHTASPAYRWDQAVWP